MSYLNTLPMVWGFKDQQLETLMDVTFDYPAKVAQQLIHDQVDVGLIPIAVIPLLKESHIIASTCIGAVGRVSSVCIFSEVPIEEIDTLILDYQSRTSIQLARLLIRDFWKIEPKIERADENFIDRIHGKTAAVVIGDRSLKLLPHKKYVYDLADAWMQHTGLPFVFAAWVANKQLPENFIQQFDAATHKGFSHLSEIIAEHPFPEYDLNVYYTQDISFNLDEEKRKGLNLFLTQLATLPSLP